MIFFGTSYCRFLTLFLFLVALPRLKTPFWLPLVLCAWTVLPGFDGI
jgi:hypothetical protein